MQGLKMFDYYGDSQRAFGQAREQKQAQGLAGLMGDYAAGGAPDLRGIQANGGNALAVRNDMQGQEDRKREQLGQFASLLVNAPASMRPGLYKQMHPQLSQLIPEAPPEYSPEIDGMAQQIAQVYGGAKGQAAGVQSSFVDAQGRRMAIMRDGSVRELGQNAPNNQIIDTGNGFYGVNKGNLSAAPVMVGQGPQTAPAAPQAPQPGMYQTPQGIVRLSDDLSPEQREAAMMDMANGGNQSQVTLPPRNVAPSQFGGGQQLRSAPKPQAAQAPTELQRRVEMARQMGATPEEIKRLVVGGGQSGNAQAQKTGQGNRIKMAQLDTVQRQIDRLDKAAQSIAGNRIFDGGPADQYAINLTPQGQELEQSAAAILPVLTALTRVPGVGAQSDLESRLASLQLPSSRLAPEVNKAAVKALREYMADLKAAYQNIGGQQSAPTAAPANTGWSIKAVD
ncbi:MAG: hypothetical protein A3E01_06950 [Gammaproteobacteria bacterium RIFCSPHIGHO2_12_FULL_63_22]|nr:MAG: hypothetical protein A3E01_06950 [Gammaproteobacteria bacterium RIFCSPHIGHO2_12_FULL_63_22]